MMTGEPHYKIDSIEFDGPLGLLLSLLRRDKVDIYDIPIASIADQYLNFVAALGETDPEIISSFIVMAATLMDIKARMLLPGQRGEAGEEPDPREELVMRLEAYEHVQKTAGILRDREKAAGRLIYSARGLADGLGDSSESIDPDRLLEGVTRESLHALYEELCSRIKRAQNERALDFGIIHRENASLGAYVESLTRYCSSHARFKFSELVRKSSSRPEVVVQFLALLELMRTGRVSVRQSRAFGEINVEVIDSTDLDKEDLTEAWQV